MFITSANKVMTSQHNDNMDLVLKIQVDEAKRLLMNALVVPTSAQIQLAREAAIEYTGLDLSEQQMLSVINLYSRLRIDVYEMKGIDDINESLCFAISHLVLACPWPIYKDKIDIDEFLKLLHRQAVKIGFKVSEESSN